MGQFPEQDPQIVRKKEFDLILSSFEEKLNTSKEISDVFYNKARSLYDFPLNCDLEVSGDSLKVPDGLVTQLNLILARLEYLNSRNTEILKHLETLI